MVTTNTIILKACPMEVTTPRTLAGTSPAMVEVGAITTSDVEVEATGRDTTWTITAIEEWMCAPFGGQGGETKVSRRSGHLVTTDDSTYLVLRLSICIILGVDS